MEGAERHTTGGQPAFRTLMFALAAASQAAARVSVVHAPPKREMQVGARGDMQDDSLTPGRSNRVLQGNQPIDISGFTVRDEVAHVWSPKVAMFCPLLAVAGPNRCENHRG